MLCFRGRKFLPLKSQKLKHRQIFRPPPKGLVHWLMMSQSSHDWAGHVTGLILCDDRDIISQWTSPLEHRISTFWVQNSEWSVLSTIAVFSVKICILWPQILDFLARNLHFLSTEFWAVYLEQFFVCNLIGIFWEQSFHFRSTEYWRA